jgi:sec-independent protein translocase protein TatB
MFPEGRIFDFLIVGIVALIVVGPKDLPLLMRKVGQFVARMRAMAAEFRASFDEMARQSELEELRREVDAMRAAHTGDLAKATALADPEVQQVFDDIHAGLRGGQAQLGPQMTPLAAPVAPPAEPAVAAEAEIPAPPKKTRTRARRKAAAEADT